MAKVHGVAGEWARVQGSVYGLWPLFLGVFAAGFSVAVLLWYPFHGAVLLAVAMVYVGWCLKRGLRRVESYFKGARGEEKVSRILQELPDDYHVFNDFLASGVHVDHVVVGPAGVFAIETKCWSGCVTVEDGGIFVSGRLPDRSPLLQVQHECVLVRETLQRRGWMGPVTPVLVFASDTFEAKIAEIENVVVLNSNHLRASFNLDRTIISPAELDRLVKVMDLKD